MSGWCDYPPEFYSDNVQIARKRHRCCECDAPIEKGEEYLYCRGKWDGEFCVFKQHILCWKACVHIRNEIQDGECIPFGGLMEWRHETGYHVPPGHAARAKTAAVEFRGMMAKILWRQRKFRSFRKRVKGVLMQRKPGQPWEVAQ